MLFFFFAKRSYMAESMIKVGEYNLLKVARAFDFGMYLGEGKDVVLLPKRFVPPGVKPGDTLKVFVYHDSENRLIATTQQPIGIVGDIVCLRVVSLTAQGAFMDWGLMKDLFVPKSKQLTGMRLGGDYLVKIYIDEQTGRVAATEKIEPFLSNELLTIKEQGQVDLIVYRRTDIGYVVIINNRHTGVLHFNDIFHEIRVGDRLKGYIKNIRENNRIDVGVGKIGYDRVEDEVGKVMRLLREHNGYLPYNDKSSPEDIYAFFGMSKKTFKMTTGNLYKNRKIVFTQTGIKLAE
jgi:predicted RNA-binding protein (virulence factor B family)